MILSRRRFCFLGAGILITGAVDPRALLPRHQSASNDGRWHYDGYRMIDNWAGIDRDFTGMPLIGTDHLRFETVYFDRDGVEIYRISDEQLRLMKGGDGRFFSPRTPPTLPELEDVRYLRAEWTFGKLAAVDVKDAASYVHQPVEAGAELARSRAQDRRIAAFIRGEQNADHPSHGRRGLHVSRADRRPAGEV